MKLKNSIKFFPYVFFIVFILIILRNVLLEEGVIYSWDMVPFFNIDQIINYLISSWDYYLQRPNYRLIQSFATVLLYHIYLQKLGLFITYLLLLIITYETIKFFLLETLEYKDRTVVIISSIFGSLIYFILAIITDFHWYNTIIVSYILTTILFLSILKIIKKSGYSRWYLIIYLIFLINPVISYNLINLIFVIFLFIFFILVKPYKTELQKIFIIFVVSILGFFTNTLFLYFSIPHEETSKSLEYELELEVRSLSPSLSFIPISMILNLVVFGDTTAFFMKNVIEKYPITQLFIILWILPMANILYLRSKKEAKYISFLILILLISSYFSTGKGIYNVLEALKPYLGKISVYILTILRKPEKWQLLEKLIISILISRVIYLVTTIPKKREIRLFNITIIILIILLPFIFYPYSTVFSGDFGGALRPIKIPDELMKAKENLNGKFILFPVHFWSRPSYMMSEKRISDEFFIYFFDKPSLEVGGGDSYKYNVEFITPIYIALIEGKVKNLGHILDLAGIEYIVFDRSVGRWYLLKDEVNKLYNELNRQKDLEVIFSGKNVSVYKVNVNSSNFRNAVIIFDKTDDEFINIINNPNITEKYALIFSCDISLMDYYELMEKIKNITVMSDDLNDTLLCMEARQNYEYWVDSRNFILNGKWDHISIADTSLKRLYNFFKKYGTYGLNTISDVIASDTNSSLILHYKANKKPISKIYLRYFSEKGCKLKIEFYNDKNVKIFEKFLELPPTNKFRFVDITSYPYEKHKLTNIKNYKIKIYIISGSIVLDGFYFKINKDYDYYSTDKHEDIRLYRMILLKNISYAKNWKLKINSFSNTTPLRSWIIIPTYVTPTDINKIEVKYSSSQLSLPYSYLILVIGFITMAIIIRRIPL